MDFENLTMRNVTTKMLRIIFIGIITTVASMASAGEMGDYQLFEKGLKESSIKVNKLNMPGLPAVLKIPVLVME